MIKNKLKQRFISSISSEFECQENFEELLNSKPIQNQVKVGNVVRGKVVAIEGEVVIVDAGLKNEGRIPLSEFALASDIPAPQVGDEIDVYVEKIEGRNGRTVLSWEKALREESWKQLEQSHAAKQLVDGVIFGRVKGGFTVDLSGVVAFLPGSLIDLCPVKNVNSLMNIVQPFQIVKIDKKLGNVVVSRRAVLEESRSEARKEMLEKVQVGMVLEGIVKNITDYGAFIDLGSIDGLLHVTDISWGRINHPSEVLHVGQPVIVVVIDFNQGEERISLGMKQLDKNPWDGIEKIFYVGRVMVGKVTNIADYGVFIRLTDNIDGLVHRSEIDWIKERQNPKKAVTIGEEVKFEILEVDTTKHRISLSIKRCKPNPLKIFIEEYPVGSVIIRPIHNIVEFGMFVRLTDCIDGMIHESDISWHGNGIELLKKYNKGDEVKCKIIAADIEKEKVNLGIKQLTENPYDSDNIKKDSNIEVTVKNICEDGIEVSLANGIIGFIKKSDLSNEKSKQIPEDFQLNNVIKAKVINVDKQNKKVFLSIKALEIEEHEKIMKEYAPDANTNSTNLGQVLDAALSQASDKDDKNIKESKVKESRK